MQGLFALQSEVFQPDTSDQVFFCHVVHRGRVHDCFHWLDFTGRQLLQLSLPCVLTYGHFLHHVFLGTANLRWTLVPHSVAG